MDGFNIKKINVNLVYELLGPNGPIPLGYTKNTIAPVLTNILENDLEDSPTTTYVCNPDSPYEFKREVPLLVDTLIERNKNFNWFHINQVSNFDEIQEKDLYVCLLESNSVSTLFDYYGDEYTELDDFFTPKLLNYIRNFRNFKIVIIDSREGAYPHDLRLIKKINRFLNKHEIYHGDNKVIVSTCNDKIAELKTNENSELFRGITLYNNNYNIFVAGRFVLEVAHNGGSIEENGYTYSLQDELNLDKKEKYFLMYNRNSSRIHRPYFVNQLYKNNLLKDGIVSLLQVDDYDDFLIRKKNSSLDELDLTVSEVNDLIENTPNFYPLKIEESDSEIVSNYHNFLSRKDEYEKTYFTIVSETDAYNDYRFLTEKTIKPIMNYHPFLILGNPGSISQLKKIGFQTFSDFWDESYDNETNFKKRVEMITSQVIVLCNKSHEEWSQMLQEMEPILRHNKNLLIKIQRYNRFVKEFILNLTTDSIL